MVQKSYIMHTGSYDFLTDTWKWVLYEQANFTLSGTTTIVTTTGGVNSGLSGGGGLSSAPEPPPNNFSMPRTPNPVAGLEYVTGLLTRQKVNSIATIRLPSLITRPNEGDPYEQTITSLSIAKLNNPIFKTGDKIVLQTQTNNLLPIVGENTNPDYNTNRISFTVSADQLANAETISVTSKIIYQDILVGDTITFNVVNLISQYQNKTEGSIAGFEVDADGLTKGGVEITGWLDSDTMTGATANNVPTAESVKAYVDAQSGGGSTALSVFSMLTCTASTITSNANGVANAVIMKFDNEAITEGPSAAIISYGSGGKEGVENSQFCWEVAANSTQRYFEFQWNVTSNTNTVNNRLLSGIRIQEGSEGRGALTFTAVAPTTSYIYDRGTGTIRKGSTAASIIIGMPASENSKFYRMQFWKESASNAGVKSESVLNGTQITIKQLK